MFHRADGVGGPGVRWLKGLSLDSKLTWLGGNEWAVRDGEREVVAVGWHEGRVSVSWKAQVFRDEAELRLYEEHSDDLTLDAAVDRRLDDRAVSGRAIEHPDDPLRDRGFIAALTAAYKRMPSVQPYTRPEKLISR